MIKILKNILILIIAVIFPVWFVYSWNWLIAENWDMLNISKWNQLISLVESKLSQNDVLAWTWVIVSQSWSNIVISSSSTSAWINSETIAVNDGSCEISTVNYKWFLNAFVEDVTVLPSGVEHVPTTYNDFWWSTNSPEWIINNNYTDLVYASSSDTPLVAVDLWSVKDIGYARIYWWNPNTYGANSWKIQASIDGVVWDDVVTGISKNTWASWDYDDYTFSWNYRYIRYYSISWVNGAWFAMSELEIFSSAGTIYNYYHIFDQSFDVNNKNGKIEICNNSWKDANVEINSL